MSVLRPGYRVWAPGRQPDDVPPYKATLSVPTAFDRPRSFELVWRCAHKHSTQAKALLCAEKKAQVWVPDCSVCGSPCRFAETGWICTRRSCRSEWYPDHHPRFSDPADLRP